MTRERDDTQLRGAILAAASVLGVPVEISDGETWLVHHGVVHVGLEYLGPERDPGAATARTLLLLWESVREVRVAPLRRARRLSLARAKPVLEPALGVLDRLLAATELVAALPALRGDVVRVLLSTAPQNPAELPRHLQWLCLLIVAAGDAATGEALAEQLEPSVQQEWRRIGRLNRDFTSDAVLRFALSLEAARDPLRRFERAYALAVPPYERLLARDIAERGLDSGGVTRGASDEDSDAADAAGSRGGGNADEAHPGGEAEDAASDGASDTARAGDHKEGAEGADLFAAEQAGFVDTVLETPLPADGGWPDGLKPPELDVAPDGVQKDRRESGGGGDRGSAGETTLGEYRGKTRELAGNIDELREIWRRVVSDRIGVRTQITRRPEPDGDMLDRDALVRIVSEVIAGVERPRAFLTRERRLKRTSREGSTDYVLLIDRSASMQGLAAESAADAALIVLESLAAVSRDIAAEEKALGISLELSIRTALIVFDSAPLIVKPLSGALDDRVRRRMHAEIRSPRGSTNDAAALDAAAHEFGLGSGSRPHDGLERRRVLIFVSDGGTDDGGAAARRIRTLRGSGVAVFGIGIRTNDLVTRFAPSGVRLNDPALLPGELAKLIVASGFDSVTR